MLHLYAGSITVIATVSKVIEFQWYFLGRCQQHSLVLLTVCITSDLFCYIPQYYMLHGQIRVPAVIIYMVFYMYMQVVPCFSTLIFHEQKLSKSALCM